MGKKIGEKLGGKLGEPRGQFRGRPRKKIGEAVLAQNWGRTPGEKLGKQSWPKIANALLVKICEILKRPRATSSSEKAKQASAFKH